VGPVLVAHTVAPIGRRRPPLIAAVTYSGFCQHIEDTELIYHAADIDLMLDQAIDEAQTSLTPTP